MSLNLYLNLSVLSLFLFLIIAHGELAFKNYTIRSRSSYFMTVPLSAFNWRSKNCHKPIKIRQCCHSGHCLDKVGDCPALPCLECVHKSNRRGLKPELELGSGLSYQEAIKQSTKMPRMTSISCNGVNCIPKKEKFEEYRGILICRPSSLTMNQLKWLMIIKSVILIARKFQELSTKWTIHFQLSTTTIMKIPQILR